MSPLLIGFLTVLASVGIVVALVVAVLRSGRPTRSQQPPTPGPIVQITTPVTVQQPAWRGWTIYGVGAVAGLYVVYRIYHSWIETPAFLYEHCLKHKQLIPNRDCSEEYAVEIQQWFNGLDFTLAASILILVALAIWKWPWWPRKSRATAVVQQGAGVAGSQTTVVANTAPSPTWEKWLPKKRSIVSSVGTGLKAVLIATAVTVAALMVMMALPADWRFIHGQAYIPVSGFVLALAIAAGCMYGESRESSRGLLMLLLAFLVLVFVMGLSADKSYFMDIMFAPRPGERSDLPYWTKMGEWGAIRFWHIWCVTVFASVFLGVLRNQPWGWFVWIVPALFLWNQLHG